MTTTSALKEITQIIAQGFAKPGEGVDDVFEQLYPNIKQLAQAELYKLNPGQQISPTMLVNECYIKLKTAKPMNFEGRQHFFNMVARCMRYYLVDLVRSHNRQKRKGQHTEFKVSQVVGDNDIALQLLDLNEALERLEQIDAELANITQLRFFSGMTLEEIAELNNTTKHDIYKKWTMAQSFLVTLLDEQKQT
ncbi:ECF-type sigma factor [Marinicella sp. W31]|uniref:ECF-type sigma factor n=1 Tax=Marinicella sp. W31 TaxID=3023713 RepID=UPI003756828B